MRKKDKVIDQDKLEQASLVQSLANIRVNSINIAFKVVTGIVIVLAMIGTTIAELQTFEKVDGSNLAILGSLMMANFVSVDVSKILEVWHKNKKGSDE